MPYLTSESEWCELRFGVNLIGGRGDGSVALSPLAAIPPTALLMVRSGEIAPVIRRFPSGVEIRVDGQPLGSAPIELYDGSQIIVGEHRLVFSSTVENLATLVKTAPAARPARATTEAAAPDAVNLSSWSLRELRTGRTIGIPREGMLVGRSADCRLVVPGRGVSRRHAIIEPNAAGFSITDQSANGTLVNGAPCRPLHALSSGDVLRIGEEDYRVEDSGSIQPMTAESERPTEVMVAIPEKPPTEAPPEPLASLEVTRGRLRGTYWSIERPVCAIGRAIENDVRINDPSVSPAHATLLLKAGTWYATDLRSDTGTYVDGYRVAGERRLMHGSGLRIGDVVLVFRARRKLTEPVRAPAEGVFKRLARIFQRPN